GMGRALAAPHAMRPGRTQLRYRVDARATPPRRGERVRADVRTVRRATLNVLPSRVCSHSGVAFAPTRPGTALALAYDSRASRGPRWQVVHRRHTRRHPRRVRHGEPARASLLPAPRLRQAVARRPPREPLPGHAVDGRLHRARGATDR